MKEKQTEMFLGTTCYAIDEHLCNFLFIWITFGNILCANVCVPQCHCSVAYEFLSNFFLCHSHCKWKIHWFDPKISNGRNDRKQANAAINSLISSKRKKGIYKCGKRAVISRSQWWNSTWWASRPTKNHEIVFPIFSFNFAQNGNFLFIFTLCFENKYAFEMSIVD